MRELEALSVLGGGTCFSLDFCCIWSLSFSSAVNQIFCSTWIFIQHVSVCLQLSVPIIFGSQHQSWFHRPEDILHPHRTHLGLAAWVRSQEVSVKNTPGRRSNLIQASCTNTPNFTADEPPAFMSLGNMERPVGVSWGHWEEGVCVSVCGGGSFWVLGGGWPSQPLIQGSPVWVGVQRVKSAVVLVTLTFTSCFATVACQMGAEKWPLKALASSVSKLRQFNGHASSYSLKLNNYGTKRGPMLLEETSKKPTPVYV